MNAVTVKSPGKIMLMGEHAVVYGYSCIVSAINKYLTVQMDVALDNTETIISSVSDHRFVNETLKQFREIYDAPFAIRLQIESELENYGLGSSSAIVVATAKALSILFHIPLTNEELFSFCYSVVKKVQGASSGFDIAACIEGGTLLFNGATKKYQKLPVSDLPLVVCNTGVKADTKSYIQNVAEKYNLNKESVVRVFDAIEDLVAQGRIALLEKDWKRLGTFFTYNQNYLEDLGVSSRIINSLIDKAQVAGAYGAKLSGAGGGDCIIVLAQAVKIPQIKKELEKSGGKILDVQLSQKGTELI